MNKSTTGKITPINQTDWARIAAMQDEDITYDVDNPMTTEADWDGAAMKVGDKVIGTVRGRGKQKKANQNTYYLASLSRSNGLLQSHRRRLANPC